MHDLFIKQQQNRAAQSANNQTRNKLMLQARNLLQAAYQVDRNDATAMKRTITSLNTYLELRASLAPAIALDGYQREIQGLVSRLKSQVADLQAVVVSQPATLTETKPSYIVTVNVEAMNWYGEATPICVTYVSVVAGTEAKASYAAAACFGDGVTAILHMDECTEQTPVSYDGYTGHSVWLREKNIRYTSVRALAVTQDELDHFHSITTNLANGKCIIA